MSKFDFVKIYDVETFFEAMLDVGYLESEDYEDVEDMTFSDHVVELYDLAEAYGYVNVSSSADVGYGDIVMADYFLKFDDRELTEQEVYDLVEYFGLSDDGDEWEYVAYEKFDLDRLDNGNFR